jgi:hypothetical protein
MNRVLESKKISPQTISGVGIAVHGSGLHIGVLYRISEGSAIRLLHLATHHALRSDEFKADYVCWVRPAIDFERAMAIAAFCRRIWKQNSNGRVAYGFTSPGRFFDATGALLAGPARIGLTCASFVLEVFDRAGLPLVDYASWPLPSDTDIARQTQLLDQLAEQLPHETEHINAARSEIGNTRFAPLDVAGAGTANELPTDFAYASWIGRDILALLKQLRDRTT